MVGESLADLYYRVGCRHKQDHPTTLKTDTCKSGVKCIKSKLFYYPAYQQTVAVLRAFVSPNIGDSGVLSGRGG